MISGDELRRLREAAGLGLRKFADRSHFTRQYLSLIERGQRPVTSAVLAAYENVLGIGVGDDGDVNRRSFLTVSVAAAANVAVLNDLHASLAGGDPEPLAVVQTSHAVDQVLATRLDGSTVRRLLAWSTDEPSDIVRVNAVGILAKLPGQGAARQVVRVIEHDSAVRSRYETAVVARLCGINHTQAHGYVQTPELIPSAELVAQRLSAEAMNPNDAGARWCAATMLAKLSPYLGQE
ncbi:helix-turn-helix domain-containing protein [Nocardia sp. NPDC004068]|uniref:helix-turn-helix domain-containing protein n=1 Tax=Nocardia sp. NPDC004068 TaxID=3364303 RepID=UPI0036CA50EB